MHTDRPLRAYDVAKANDILDKAGWVKGADGVRSKNGVRLALQFVSYTGAADTDQLIELLRQSWAQIGVQFDVKRINQALFFAPVAQGGPIFAGKFDVTSFSWGQTPDADYTSTLGCEDVPPKGENVARFCDPRDREAAAAGESGVRRARPQSRSSRRLDDRLAETVPYFVLYIRDEIHAYNHDLQDWHPSSSTPFDDFMNVDI